jgi:hypothetical protein
VRLVVNFSTRAATEPSYPFLEFASLHVSSIVHLCTNHNPSGPTSQVRPHGDYHRRLRSKKSKKGSGLELLHPVHRWCRLIVNEAGQAAVTGLLFSGSNNTRPNPFSRGGTLDVTRTTSYGQIMIGSFADKDSRRLFEGKNGLTNACAER